jgi:hypothetical protein
MGRRITSGRKIGLASTGTDAALSGARAGSLAIGRGLSSATGPGTARGPASHGGATAGDGHGSSGPRAPWRIARTETVSGAMVYKIR